MAGKSILSIALAFILCFTVAFAAQAAEPAAKDLLLENIGSFDLGFSKDYYDKSQEKTTINITQCSGSLLENADFLKGTSIDLFSQMDASNNVIKIEYDTNVNGNNYNGQVYLKDDKIIFTKDFFYLLTESGLEASEDNRALLEQSNEYLYSSNEQLKGIWEQLADYQNQQLPEEYKDLLLFLVEAVPDRYFSQSGNQLTMQLDQDGLEEFIYNLLTKIKDEKERVAGIIVDLNKYNYDHMDLTPEQAKQEIIAGIDSMPVIPMEQIKLLSNFVQVNDFTYETSLLPGGTKKFNLDLSIKAPDSSVSGQLVIAAQSSGTENDLQGTYTVSAGFNAQDSPRFDFLLDCVYKGEAEAIHANTGIEVTAIDNATGEVLADFAATARSTSEVNHDLVINAPVLTDANSTDITSLISNFEQETQVVEKRVVTEESGPQIIVNGINLATDVPPAFDNGQTMVPARAVLEAMGCGVQWVEPGEVQITAGNDTITVSINESSYKINGVDKAISVPPYIESGRTMIPASFIADELAASVDVINETTVIITK